VIYVSVFTVEVWFEMLQAIDVVGTEAIITDVPIGVTIDPTRPDRRRRRRQLTEAQRGEQVEGTVGGRGRRARDQRRRARRGRRGADHPAAQAAIDAVTAEVDLSADMFLAHHPQHRVPFAGLLVAEPHLREAELKPSRVARRAQEVPQVRALLKRA
jgi:hypothetical protein